jgi:hypothetical protein
LQEAGFDRACAVWLDLRPFYASWGTQPNRVK